MDSRQAPSPAPSSNNETTHAPTYGAIWPSDRLPSRGPTISPTVMQAQTSTPMDLTPTASTSGRRDTSSTSMSEDPRSSFSVRSSMAAPPQHVTWSIPSDDFPPLGRTISAPTYGNMPAPRKSPSVASSGVVEDGIFEPGSTYQTLHQTLRSHVFRTAYSTPAPLHTGLHDHDLSPASSGLESTQGARPLTAHETSGPADAQGNVVLGFELDAALEFKLWKAWTEEVSNWVSPISMQLPSLVHPCPPSIACSFWIGQRRRHEPTQSPADSDCHG